MRTFADLLAIYDATPAIDPGDTSIQLSPHDALLQQLGLIVIGEHEGMQRIEIYCTDTRKAATLYDIDKLTIPKLTQLVGHEKVEKHVHDGNKAPAGQVLIKDVRLAIANAASDRVYTQEQKFGAGVHEIDKQVVLVKSQERGIVNCKTIERSSEPFIGRWMVDLSRASKEWCDIETVERYLLQAHDIAWRMKTFDEVEAIFSKWYWRYPNSPTMVTSMVICTWLQALWPFRPEIAITGDSGCGKSHLMGRVLRHLFGDLAFYSIDATEAAVRQKLKHSMLAVLIDEFEDSYNRRAVMKLFRGAGNSVEVYRGTRDQRGTSFLLKHIPWFGSIETGLHKEQDANRFMVFELNRIPREKKGHIHLPSFEQLNDMGLKLLAIGLACQSEARRLDQYLRTQQTEQVAGRLVELFSVACSMISAVYGHTVEQALEYQAQVLGSWDFESQQHSSSGSLLSEIFTTEIFAEGGKRHTISQLLRMADLQTVAIEDDKTLHRAGIARVTKRETGSRYIFFNCEFIRKSLLKPSSDFYGQSVEQHLMRVEGAIRDRQRLGGSERFRGVSIPVETLDSMFDAGQLGEDTKDFLNS